MPDKVYFHICYFYADILTVFGPVFVCVAALAILDRLDAIDVDTLAWWLAERQLPNGGLNGRPEKLEDVNNFSQNSHTVLFLTN